MSILSIGSRGDAVRKLQGELKAAGFSPGAVDGQFGKATADAVKAFQKANGLTVDGQVGNATLRKLQQDGFDPPVTPPTTPVTPPSTAAVPNRSATFESVTNPGTTSQMVSGRVTVNGHTYKFNSGGHGEGNLPAGDYTVTPHLWSRKTEGMVVDGVGFSFALSNKFDPRVGQTRTELRIHPDGADPGTHGCIGIVGDGATEAQFREDMRAEFAKSPNNSFTLHVG